ncbi:MULTISPECIES: multicopper oxidase family protein [unclassified Isoptericola]|uniref:multicopper oxidase family protein n=1 Tax=unclassified Isoptericola TaxID=2623355 RepID=UPI0027133D78|nr:MULTISPECIES: multicopper oxidase family protein [unclassified Isoptericola]MDO8149669.1 multicopper oxidase family protein [Isoptericola sp. b515]MDO8152604.1 multicopper oxidase family protein [Isoptericola sp. b408]
MEPISRRTALTLGGLGLVSATVGGVGLWRELSTTGTTSGATGETLRAPEVVRSTDGVLDVRLEAARGTHEIAGRRATTLAYNGGVPGPTLRVRAGDTVRVELVNSTDETTNLHVHGLHVSPEGTADNVFLAVEPGGSQQYEYMLPADHPAGTYWYHPHHHGTVADQLFGGLYGAIVVEEDDALPVTRERTLVIADITLDGAGAVAAPSAPERMMGREGELLLVNGQRRPRLRAAAGERERWRIVNACASRYLDLSLAGQSVRVIGRDGPRSTGMPSLDDAVLAPGNRLDLVVDMREGTGELVAAPFDRGGPMGRMMGGGTGAGGDDPVVVADLAVAAGPGADLGPLPPAPAPRDLRGAPVDRRRTLRFAMGRGGTMAGDGGRFTIDGRTFDPERVDQQVRLGTVEEWTIVNDSPMNHPFHLHVWPMQVVTAAGVDPPAPLWLDVVDVPAGQSVTVRVPFEDFGGRTVYHCHILDHEDLGMMGVVTAR